MSLSVGIVGLPNVGKSTIFNALTNSNVASENYAFCTIDPNHGIVKVPDSRISIINKYIETKKTIYNTIEFVDIAGLVKGASSGEGLGNKFLSQIRNVDAIIHVIRCFDNNDITHVDNTINPIRDIETVNTELILKDMESVDKRIRSISKNAKSGDKEAKQELLLLEKIISNLNENKMIHDLQLNNTDKNYIKSFALLTSKPMIFVANVSDQDLLDNSNIMIKELYEYSTILNKRMIILSGIIEMEISNIDKDSQDEYLHEFGLKESGLNKMIRCAYDILNL